MSILHDRRLIEMWRSQYNPMRGLVMSRVVSIIEAAERGEYSQLQKLLRVVEKRFPVYLAGKLRRKNSLEKLDWNIKERPEEELPDGITPAMVEQQSKALRSLYEGIGNLKEAIARMEGANFKGYAHLEKLLLRDSEPWQGITRLEWVEQWHWVRDGLYGDWEYNKEAVDGTHKGVEVDPERFVIREVEDYFYEIALILFVRYSTAQKDWDGFLEVFGIPAVFVILPELGNKEDLPAFLEMAEKVASDTRGALPGGSSVETVEPKGQGVDLFEKYSAYQDSQLVLVMTGGKLTMLAESGSGTLAGGAHQDSFDDIMQGEAMRISEVFQEQLDIPFLQHRFPGQPVCAYFEIAANEENDVGEITENVKRLKEAGYRVKASYIAEKTGLELEEIEEEPTDEAAAKDETRLPGDQSLPTDETKPKVMNRQTIEDPTADRSPPMDGAEAKAVVMGVLAEQIDSEFHPMISALLDSDLSPDALQHFRDQLPQALLQLMAASTRSDILTRAFAALHSDAIVAGAVDAQNATGSPTTKEDV